jgi:hypothetical protein
MTNPKKHHIGEICPESGIYRLTHFECVSKKQAEIPMTKGHRFPPCRNCPVEVEWVLVRKAELDS